MADHGRHQPGGYGGPRPGDFGGCTYRPMGQMPAPDADHSGGWGCAAAVMVLVFIAIIAILL